MRSWVSIRVVRQLWYQFWHDASRLPQGVWQRWVRTLAVGLGLCALVTFVLTLMVKRGVEQGNLQAWDDTMLVQLANALPLSFSRSITWESPGNLLGMVPVVAIFVGLMVQRSQPLLAATMLAAYGLQFALVWIGWGYWNRDRPDLIANGVAASGLHSFPSGHTVVVISVYGLLAYLWGRASNSWVEKLLILILFILWSGLIISSRLVLGAHWPTDILVGLIIGILWLCVVIVALIRAEAASTIKAHSRNFSQP